MQEHESPGPRREDSIEREQASVLKDRTHWIIPSPSAPKDVRQPSEASDPVIAVSNSPAVIIKRKKEKCQDRLPVLTSQSGSEPIDDNSWAAPVPGHSLHGVSRTDHCTATKVFRSPRQSAETSSQLRHTKRRTETPSQVLSPVPSGSSSRTFSAASLRGNVFLRKSLGGLLAQGGDQDRNVQNRTQNNANLPPQLDTALASLVISGLQQDEPRSNHFESLEFEDIPLTAPTDDIKVGKLGTTVRAGSLKDTMAAIGAQELAALPRSTPEASNQAENISKGDSQSPESVGAGVSEVGKTISDDNFEGDATLRAKSSINQDGAVTLRKNLRLSSLTEGLITISTAPLRPTASSFVPTGTVRSVLSASSPHDTSGLDNSPSDFGEQARKRPRLRPIAPSFVPHLSNSTHKRLHQVAAASVALEDGPRNAPSSFAFAPQIPNLRPTAPSFVPTLSAPPPVLSKYERSSMPSQANQFPRLNPAFFQQGMGRPQAVPPTHANPAFLERGAIPSFALPNPITYDQQDVLSHPGPSPRRKVAESMDVSDMFYNRPISTVKTEGTVKSLLRKREPSDQIYDVGYALQSRLRLYTGVRS